MATPFPFLCGPSEVEWFHNVHRQTCTHTHPSCFCDRGDKQGTRAAGYPSSNACKLENTKEEKYRKRSRSTTTCLANWLFSSFYLTKMTWLHFYQNLPVKWSTWWCGSLSNPFSMLASLCAFRPFLPPFLSPKSIHLISPPTSSCLHFSASKALGGRCVCARFITRAHQKNPVINVQAGCEGTERTRKGNQTQIWWPGLFG